SVILGMEHGAGHSELDPQDMRNMGGLRRRMPLTFWVYLIGALALSGIAPLAGFFSKDEILAAASLQSPAVFVVLVIAAFFTAFYMGRQVLMVFFGKPRSDAAGHAAESPALVTVPLILLALLSVAGGALNLPGSHLLETWLEHSLAGVQAGEFLLPVALGSLGVALLGIFIAWLIYGRKPLADAKTPDPLARPLGAIFRGMENKWKVDEFYHLIVVQPYQALAEFFAGPVDQGLIDGLVNGVASLLASLGQLVRRLQTGFVRTYALAVLVGVVAVLAYLATVSAR
ncbi:NADH-quinone oxidoreductase subunit L, partial [bacterium]